MGSTLGYPKVVATADWDADTGAGTGAIMTPRDPIQSLSLFHIERGLLELVEAREDLLQTMSNDPYTIDFNIPLEARQKVLQRYIDDIKSLDDQIQRYVAAEIRKVDGIASWIRECETRRDIAITESNRLHAEGMKWRDRGEQIREMVLGIMRESGDTKLEGRGHSLHRKRNPPSVEVRQPELVPLPYKTVAVKLTGEHAMALQDYLTNGFSDHGTHEIVFCKVPELLGEAINRATPSLSTIRADIRAGVPGCQLITDRYRLEVDPATRGKRKPSAVDSPGELGIDKLDEEG